MPRARKKYKSQDFNLKLPLEIQHITRTFRSEKTSYRMIGISDLNIQTLIQISSVRFANFTRSHTGECDSLQLYEMPELESQISVCVILNQNEAI